MDYASLWFGVVGLIIAVLIIGFVIKCVKDDSDD